MAGLLSGKLKSLRSQAGAKAFGAPEPGATIEPPTVRVRDEMYFETGQGLVEPGPQLERLRRQFQLRHAPVKRPKWSESDLADAVDGYLAAPGLIEVKAELVYPHPCGALFLEANALEAAREFLPVSPDIGALDTVIVLDTETSGLSGGTGTVPFLVGATVLTRDSTVFFQWLMTRFEGEAHMLTRLKACIAAAQGARACLLTYNGAAFDLPLLETRARLNGIRLDLESHQHLDLLHWVRRAFSGRWPNCRLQTAEQLLLEFTREDDTPGHEVPAHWFDWMRHGDGRGLEGVMRHNRLDIINLAALLQPLRDAFHDPAAYGARIVPAKLHTAGEEGVYAELLNNQGILDSSECLELARLAKRKGAWCVAEAALCPLAARRDPAAMLQLAKLCEHQLGDIERALELTLSLAALRLPPKDIHIRLERLESKRAQQLAV